MVNANGITNVFDNYVGEFQTGHYYLVFAFCDTDRNKVIYNQIKKQVDAHYNISNIHTKLVIFGNPCTMQIFLRHFSNSVILKTHSKRKNAPIIEKCTGIPNYDAHKSQRKQLMALITQKKYKALKKNLLDLPPNDQGGSGTNILWLLNNLESEDISWVDKLADSLNQK